MELNKYRSAFLEHLKNSFKDREPKNLYTPIYYILNLGGKRIRPILTLMSCDLFGGTIEKSLDASLAIEMFHNFSLIHDDIMDKAPLRRGKETVHEKWDINTGILSGDAMLILANQLLESYEGKLHKELVSLFSTTALEVCEGQQYDIDFENRELVTVNEYLHMITLKTAVLLAAALQYGAIIATASPDDIKSIYQYGLNLGIAFQLQDDYLDAFGDPKTFGKQIGGDIIENKKTLLYIKTLEIASEKDKQILQELYIDRRFSDKKVELVMALFLKYNMPSLMEKEINKYTKLAIDWVDRLSLNANKKDELMAFSKFLMARKV